MAHKSPLSVTRLQALISHVDEDVGADRKHIPEPCPSSFLTSFPIVMDRPPSRGSTLTDTSTPDSLFSKLSAAGSSITEPAQSSDALEWASPSKGGSTDTP